MRYLLATYFRKPNGKYSESVKVDDKIRNAALRTASVILDYRDRKVVKMSIDGERDFDILNDFYKQHYSNLISQLEAKYQILDTALETIKEVLDEADAVEAAAKVEEIAKGETLADEEVTNAKAES